MIYDKSNGHTLSLLTLGFPSAVQARVMACHVLRVLGATDPQRPRCIAYADILRSQILTGEVSA